MDKQKNMKEFLEGCWDSVYQSYKKIKVLPEVSQVLAEMKRIEIVYNSCVDLSCVLAYFFDKLLSNTFWNQVNLNLRDSFTQSTGLFLPLNRENNNLLSSLLESIIPTEFFGERVRSDEKGLRNVLHALCVLVVVICLRLRGAYLSFESKVVAKMLVEEEKVEMMKNKNKKKMNIIKKAKSGKDAEKRCFKTSIHRSI